ncbi:uncharacterized protein SAPINGB_P003512 [Magnusiomyces paraingens]|uniref:histone deacetylase n=1 Tax=Magnusiomyces paraingens TaxID=2606893 RepID=A0A5E8BV66_9ASCO|nr:uncharacterized protein SAPINGB_P003512 [Saprochaete ingens]VVT53317.1 unnamed protein product [Saprochaete ingens]
MTIPERKQGPIGYACSRSLLMAANKLPSNPGRAILVHTLLHAYKLFSQNQEPNKDDQEPQCKVIPVKPLGAAQLKTYHDAGFVDFILELDSVQSSDADNDAELESSSEEDEEDSNKPPRKRLREDVRHKTPQIMIKPNSSQDSKARKRKTKLYRKYEAYGLEYDCPYFPGISDYVRLVAGASVACAEYILEHEKKSPSTDESDIPQQAPIAINWQGGRHHARKTRAAGFCYVNDAVLCIQRLRKKFSRVAYIDLDLHHGDGVETAFARSSNVAVVSVHRYDRGFYPGSPFGSLEYEGGGNTKYMNSSGIDSNNEAKYFGKLPGYGYTLNIPTKRGLTGESLDRIMREIVTPFVTKVFCADCAVVVLGTDGLSRDEHREWRLSPRDYERAMREHVRDAWNLPTVVLGGGGYHHADTARALTAATAALLGRRDQDNWVDIPEHAMMDAYCDDAYEFWAGESISEMNDENAGEHLDHLVEVYQARFKRKYK